MLRENEMKSLIFPMFFLVAAVAVSAGEARVVSCPEGSLSASVRAAKIPETAEFLKRLPEGYDSF
jgi:hypothetical protein